METPCINVCTIDPASRLCIGCKRTIEEITAWAGLGSEERRRIMRDLPRRGARADGELR
jgi:hypothetical protein